MSWIKSAVNKAVEVGGNSNLTRTVRVYADSVVQQAGQVVTEGAKVLQDRIVGNPLSSKFKYQAARNFRNFKQSVKRLEEVSVSYRGIERTQLLRRWLVALKEIERIYGDSVEIPGKNSEQLLISDESKEFRPVPTLVWYHDADIGGEAMNFWDMFLHSQALEGMTMSMILEAPNEEEVSLLMQIFGLCLRGGKEVHNATMSSIQDLAKTFSNYKEEVLVRREELLQYVQAAMAGLKVNADIARIDSQVSDIFRNLDKLRSKQLSTEGHDESFEEKTFGHVESLKEAIDEVELCSKLEALLQRKKHLKNGDSPQVHAQRVDKLKVLSESLANSALKAEKRISDHRLQKEEALNFRVTKTNEVSQIEKELMEEIVMLEQKRDEFEAELRKVNSSLAAAYARLHNAKDEREQFDDASNKILEHLKTKEDELSKSITCYRAEADVCNAFVNFLEKSWVFHSKFLEQTEKLVNDEFGRYAEYFVKMAIRLLSAYKDELGSSITSFRKLVENLNTSKRSEFAVSADDEHLHEINPRKDLEEEYLKSEAKFISAFNVVYDIKKQFYSQNEEIYGYESHDNQKVKELFDDLEKIKNEFEYTERPRLKPGSPVHGAETVSKQMSRGNVSSTFELNQNDELGSSKTLRLEPVSPSQKAKGPLKSSSPLKHATNDKLEPDDGSKNIVFEIPSQRAVIPLGESVQMSGSPTFKQSPNEGVTSNERLKLENKPPNQTEQIPSKDKSLNEEVTSPEKPKLETDPANQPEAVSWSKESYPEIPSPAHEQRI